MAEEDRVAPRRTQRALTQKYDMPILKAVQTIEAEFVAAIAALYGCDEDEIPFDYDTLTLYNSDPATRRDVLTGQITNPPSSPASIIDTVIRKLEELDPKSR